MPTDSRRQSPPPRDRQHERADGTSREPTASSSDRQDSDAYDSHTFDSDVFDAGALAADLGPDTATVSLRAQTEDNSTKDTVILRKSSDIDRAGSMARAASSVGSLPGVEHTTSSLLSGFTALEGVSRDMGSAVHVIRNEQGSYSLASPAEAMWHNELARYRHVTTVVLCIVTIGILTLPFISGSEPIKIVLYGCMSSLGIACLWQRYLLLHRPEKLRRWGIGATWIIAGITTCVAVLFFGVFSAATVLMAVEVMLIGLTSHTRLVYVFYALMVGFTGVLIGLFATGVVADPGVVFASYLDSRHQILGLVLVAVLITASLFIGLSTRREILTSFEKLQHAARLVSQHEAMMREVRQELQRAANVGGRGPLTDEVLGSFKLGLVIGRGGMGEVYRAVNTETDELAAIKVLQAAAMQEPGAKMRFAREVEVARSLNVPNIVRVIEFGDDATMPYLAMEYLRGHDLARYLRKHGRLSPEQVIKLLDEVGAGIHAAGEAGIVHRDLKPHNLFHTRLPDKTWVWKILDFGVATLATHSGTLTQGRVIGTPAYMAPEQARGRAVDHRSDLYALASIAYRSLTGHPPYSGDDLPAVLYQVVHEMPGQPSRLADIPVAVDAVLAIGMAKNPSDRFQTATELVTAMKRALDGQLSDELRERADRLLQEHPWHL